MIEMLSRIYWSSVVFKSDDSTCLPGTDRVDQGQDQVRGRGQDSEQSQDQGIKQSQDQGIKQSQDQGIEQSQDLGIKQSRARGQVLPPEVRPLQRGQDHQAQRKQRQMKRKKILKVKFSNFERKGSR